MIKLSVSVMDISTNVDAMLYVCIPGNCSAELLYVIFILMQLTLKMKCFVICQVGIKCCSFAFIV